MLDDSEVEDFIQEDEGCGSEEDDAFDTKVAEEHDKFLQAKAEWQEKVRGSRSWSAPPLESPGPDDQREQELQKAAQQGIDAAEATARPRDDYVPPERTFLAQDSSDGRPAMSYMAPARPLSAESGRSGQRGAPGSAKSSTLQGIMEESPSFDKSAASDQASTPKMAPPQNDSTTSPQSALSVSSSESAATEEAFIPDKAADMSTLNAASARPEAEESQSLQDHAGTSGLKEGSTQQGSMEGRWVVGDTSGSIMNEDMASQSQRDGEEAEEEEEEEQDVEEEEQEADVDQSSDAQYTEDFAEEQQADAASSRASASASLMSAAKPAVIVPTTLSPMGEGDDDDDIPEDTGSSPEATPEASAASLAGDAAVEKDLQSDTAATEYGEMLHPHEFALQLLAHDLRTLPAYQNGTAWGARPRSGHQPPGAWRGAPTNKPGGRPVSAPARPVPAPAKRAAQPDMNRAVYLGSGATGKRAVVSASSRRRAPSVSSSLGGTEMVMAASRALRAEPSVRDSMASGSAAGPLGRPPAVPRGDWEQAGSELDASSQVDTPQQRWLGAAAGSAGSCQASRQQRPASARPAYGSPAAGGLGAGFGSTPEQEKRVPQRRPQSAQPTTGARYMSWDGAHGWYDGGKSPAVSPPPGAGSNAATATVNIGGATVSVYVSDTQKRIVEANQWLAALGSSNRYQLQSPFSNTSVQLLSACHGQRSEAGDWDEASMAESEAGLAFVAVKTMPLAKFLSAHKRLKAQVQQGAGRLEPRQRHARRSEPTPGWELDSKLLLGPTGSRTEKFREAWLLGGGGGYDGMLSGPEQPPPACPVDIFEAEPGSRAQDVKWNVSTAAYRCQELAEHINALRQF